MFQVFQLYEVVSIYPYRKHQCKNISIIRKFYQIAP